jgi:hypothetical protein
MNETVGSFVVGLVAAAGIAYLGFKIHQDRERLRRIVGIIDADHSFDMDYLFQLVDNGRLTQFIPATIPAT